MRSATCARGSPTSPPTPGRAELLWNGGFVLRHRVAIRDAQGRVATFSDMPIGRGTYRLTFDTGAYHRDQGITAPFFPEVRIVFSVRDADAHHHVPLLLGPYGYSTYRGT